MNDGVDRFDGTLFDEHERHALHVLAENVPGVRSVDDRMFCMEPTSGVVISEGDVKPVKAVAS